MQVNDLVITCAAIVFAGVIAHQLEITQVLVADIAGYIFTGKYRGVELLDLRVTLVNRPDQVLEILENQPVCTDFLAYLSFGTTMCNQFGR